MDCERKWSELTVIPTLLVKSGARTGTDSKGRVVGRTLKV